ncbi:MAG: 30S ribosomal protein S17 [Candidatus Omnitrophica bacterium]|nr:30S ribosomal protein S17 [Candidatus Omnitrophota bacterium]
MRKIRIGKVVSNRMKDTIVVRIDSLARHGFYQRVVRRSAKFKAHDAGNTARIGDVVKIMETRPISKDKRWRLIEILRHDSAAEPIVEPGETPSE